MLALPKVRDYEYTDEGAVLALAGTALGVGPAGMRDEAFWRWKHHDNYFGPSFILIAENHSDAPIGLRALMRWRFKAGDHILQAVRAVDTATHPGYRRAGVFSTLTRRAIERVRSAGIDLVFNTPNDTVLPGYLKLGWHKVAAVQPLVKVLNYPRFMLGLARSRGRNLPSQPCSPEQLFRHEPPRATDVVDQADEIDGLLLRRDSWRSSSITTCHSTDYFRWRYAQHPHIDYRAVLEKRRGQLAGFLMFRMNSRFGLKEAVLDELLLASPEEQTARALLGNMVACVKADYVVAYFAANSFERHALRRLGFHQIPRQAMTFVVNTLVPGITPDPLYWGNWDLSLGDLEIF
jgi:GNAT superfamily N-acetyltransferase